MAAHFAAIDAPDIFCHETWDHVGAWIFYISSPVSFLMESDAEIWELRRHMKTTTVGRMASTKLFVAGNLDIKFAVDEEKNMLSFRTWKCCLKLPVS